MYVQGQWEVEVKVESDNNPQDLKVGRLQEGTITNIVEGKRCVGKVLICRRRILLNLKFPSILFEELPVANLAIGPLRLLETFKDRNPSEARFILSNPLVISN